MLTRLFQPSYNVKMRKSKAALQLFQDTTLRKEYVQPQPLMPFPDASQRPQCPTQAPQTSVKLGSSLWLCHLFFLSTFFFNLHSISQFLTCFSPAETMQGAHQKISLGGLQMVSAARQNEDVLLSLCCSLIAFSTARK